MDYIVLGCRCLVGLVLLASVVGKLRGRGSYAGFVGATGRLGPRWVISRVPAGVLAGGVIGAEAAVLVLLGLAAGAAAAGQPEPAGVVAAVVAGAVIAALVVTADDVAELFRPVVLPDGHHAAKGSP